MYWLHILSLPLDCIYCILFSFISYNSFRHHFVADISGPKGTIKQRLFSLRFRAKCKKNNSAVCLGIIKKVTCYMECMVKDSLNLRLYYRSACGMKRKRHNNWTHFVANFFLSFSRVFLLFIERRYCYREREKNVAYVIVFKLISIRPIFGAHWDKKNRILSTV